MNIVSKEFESFLGQKKENTRMLTALTDLYDCPDEFSARTRHSGSIKIIRPWVNLLAATTPESLANSLPASAVGGGLTSRVLFVWANKKKRNVAIPDMTPEEVKLKELLEKDLYVISRMSGDYLATTDCLERWTDWYNHYDEDESGNRICPDKSFSGWYSRKPTTLLKVAMLQSAAESSKLVLEWRHIERAMADVKRVEQAMGNAFKAIGRSEISGDVANVLQVIRESRVIGEKKLMSMIMRDVDAVKFENVIDTCLKTGKVTRSYKGPDEEKGIYYYSNEPTDVE